MGKAVYKKDVSGYLDMYLEPILKEAEYNDYAAYDENWEKFENENWLNHEEIEKEVADAVKATLEKLGVSVREIRFVITESMDDSWDI
jgi:hypothetical protein